MDSGSYKLGLKNTCGPWSSRGGGENGSCLRVLFQQQGFSFFCGSGYLEFGAGPEKNQYGGCEMVSDRVALRGCSGGFPGVGLYDIILLSAEKNIPSC